ncbi:signal peptidase II [Mycoplasma sp. 1018B]|uniref:signal peptidase II n=1 Tax=Mycoplasma sp. 1018B TaxID=2967302 RepID=UPI00211BEAD4|nr:signal peptidase II [Mycoplasma sp. 1018B]UUM19015.1 signal peptidase II [Mycoplasma sp. 1018B]
MKNKIKIFFSQNWIKLKKIHINKFIFYRQNYKNLIYKYLLFIIILVVFLLLDQLTKTFLFEWNDTHTDGTFIVKADLGIIGIRSIGHRGVTILPWKDNTLVIALIQTISILMILIFFSVPFYSDKKILIIIVALISSGAAGNMLDRFFFEGGMVKDILFIPFLEKWRGKQLGTFNLADVFVFLGAISYIIYFLLIIFKTKKETKNSNENEQFLNSNQDENYQQNVEKDKNE